MTWYPALAKWQAIPAPMTPEPSTVIFLIVLIEKTRITCACKINNDGESKRPAGRYWQNQRANDQGRKFTKNGHDA